MLPTVRGVGGSRVSCSPGRDRHTHLCRRLQGALGLTALAPKCGHMEVHCLGGQLEGQRGPGAEGSGDPGASAPPGGSGSNTSVCPFYL